jgi:hypothetical protein
MSDASNNPQVAGIRWRQGTCLDSTAFTQYQAVKLSGPNTYVPCLTTDTDNDVAGIVLADRSPGQARSVPVALLSSDIPLPVLSDGSGIITAGSTTVGWLSLSGTVAGAFAPSARGTGCLRAVTSASAASGVVLAAGLSGSGGGSSGYPNPSTTADSVSGGAITIDGTIKNTLHLVALSGNATLAITSPVAGETYQFLVTNAGAFNITAWPGNFLWVGGSVPTITSGGVDLITAAYNGANFYASAAQAFA